MTHANEKESVKGLGKKPGKNEKGITVKKDEDFSEWYTQLITKAELADVRYNVKGFVCYLPWATKTIKKMYEKYEKILEQHGHDPLVMPSVIPESNFTLESSHVEGFAPEVFWITETGSGEKLDERLALRPTSETALYKMYSLWIRSYRDLPFKRYQSCQVWRCEGKATRPFFRAREFHWIEAHNVFATEEEARNQVIEDMNITYTMLQDEFAIPVIFFQRPEWDKFPGAVHTYAADALMKSGKVIQLPSTHLLGQNFSKPFNVTFKDKDEQEKFGYITCYGPAISRIYGAMIAILSDDQGLVLPFDLSPLQVVIVPILFEDTKDAVLAKCESIKKDLLDTYTVQVDSRDYLSPGEKFNEWELKGVPIRIEIGPKDLEKNHAKVVIRHNGLKEFVGFDTLRAHVDSIADSYTLELKKKTFVAFDERIEKVYSFEEAKNAIDSGKIACCGFCSIDTDGTEFAEKIEKELGAFIRGVRVDDEDNTFEKCIVSGKPAKVTVYIAKSY
ncbi:MAG: proline--tRNA ligase, partial [Candidatus Woesearchaeota archaeon]